MRAFIVISLAVLLAGPATAAVKKGPKLLHIAQMSLTGAGGVKKVSGGGGGLDPATTAWISAVTGAGGSVSGTQQTRVNTLVVCLKTNGLFTIGDRLWLYAGESDVHQAAIDLINLSAHTLVSTPTLSATGYAGNGSSFAINTNFNLSTAINYAQNSASAMVYDQINEGPQPGVSIGGGDGTNYLFFEPGSPAGFMTTNVNDGTFASTIVNTGNNTQGMWILSRTASTGLSVYKNGSSAGTATATSGPRPNVTVSILADNNNGTNGQFYLGTLSAVWLGAGLNATQAGNLTTCINAYMTAWGVNVF